MLTVEVDFEVVERLHGIVDDEKFQEWKPGGREYLYYEIGGGGGSKVGRLEDLK